MDWQTLGMFIGGFALLVLGAELLVRGASTLAIAIGVTPLIVGQTVVAYGTSAPELAISMRATSAGQPDIAIGNVVGSNISNILLVLGISALIRPLSVSPHLVRVSVPLMIVFSLLVPVLAWDGRISRIDGALLAIGAVLYSGFCILQSRREARALAAEPTVPVQRTWGTATRQLVALAIGLACLVLGANYLVEGAVDVAEALGISQLVIGLTIVAIGTSLPEIATSILAGLRGASDIALGNAVGSNIFNILLVLGVCAAFSAEGVPVSQAAMRFDIPVMIVVAVSCLPVFFTGMTIARWEAALFIAYYAAYVLYLLMLATQHDAVEAYSSILFGFLAPLTVATLIALAWRSHRKGA